MNWHAATVHLPIGLILIWPFVDGLGLLLRQPMVSRTGMALLVVATVSSLFATATGQAEFYEAMEAGVSVEQLNTHADYANMMPWLLVVLTGLRFWLPTKLSVAGAWLVVALGLGQIAFTAMVGHSGGVLVYEHGVGTPTQNHAHSP